MAPSTHHDDPQAMRRGLLRTAIKNSSTPDKVPSPIIYGAPDGPAAVHAAYQDSKHIEARSIVMIPEGNRAAGVLANCNSDFNIAVIVSGRPEAKQLAEMLQDTGLSPDHLIYADTTSPHRWEKLAQLATSP